MQENKIKLAYILRGIPGSARQVFAQELGSNGAASFIQAEVTDYSDKEKYNAAHKSSFKSFCDAVKAEKTPIIVNNTNVRNHHYYQYVDYAQRHDYNVLICIAPINDKSDRELARATGISELSIRRLRDSFDWKMEKPEKVERD